jgi:lipid A 3-O-deacylase
MQNPFLKLIAGLTIGVSTCAGAGDLFAEYARARAEGSIAHIVDIDNDTLLLDRNDGFYTSGLRYTQTHTLRDGGGTTVFGWRFGQELYTASDIKLAPEFVMPPNHPYAGWLYGGFFREIRRPEGTHTRVGIDIGCLGPCAGGEWTQTQFHRILNQPLPRGWSKQVKNEAGVVLHGEIAPVRWAPSTLIDMTPVLNARVGNIFTDAGAGLLVRAGQLNPLPSRSALHVYLQTEVRAVGYNATLQGGYFSKGNPHTVDPKRIVGNAQAGIAWNYGPFAATLAIVRRGNEIRDLPDSVGAQNYVHMQFSYVP